MRTFREFMVIAEKAEKPMTPEQIAASRARKAEVARRLAQTGATPGERAAAEAAAERLGTKTTRIPSSNVGFGGQRPPSQPESPSAAQRARDAFNRGKQAVKNAASRAADTTPRQAAQSVKNAASRAVNDAKTTMKYGRPIRPNTSTSALATRSSELARAANTTSNLSRGLKLAGRAVAPIAFAADVASERSKGSGLLRSLAKGAVSAAGGALGAAGGSVAGPVGTVAGGAAGAAAASRAFDTVAGANAVQRKAMATANRQRQSGGALVGTGGKTTFDTKKNTMTTGNKTVNLAKTSVVKDPKSGKAETGFLAYKGGKAVYKRAADPSTLAQTSSNPLERIGRSLFAGAYKKSDETARQSRLTQAAQSDIKRQQALGVKGSQNLVGPKIVGPKIVGPKPAK